MTTLTKEDLDKYWEYQLASSPETRVVCEGQHYRLGTSGKEVPSRFKGHGGMKFRITWLGGGPDTITDDLWYQGRVPDNFLDRFPDNAKSIEEDPRDGR